MCSRCKKEFKRGDRIVADPCCGAPDCEGIEDVNHFECLPRTLQMIEMEEN